jgi:hypothetical protein
LSRRSDAWIIEVKSKLTRGVIGQLLAGADLFERQFGRAPTKLVAVCGRIDPALEWVCERRNIFVQQESLEGAGPDYPIQSEEDEE